MRVELVVPRWLAEGAMAYVRARGPEAPEQVAARLLSPSHPAVVTWRPGLVTCAAGDSARVRVGLDDGSDAEVWRSLEALRVHQDEETALWMGREVARRRLLRLLSRRAAALPA